MTSEKHENIKSLSFEEGMKELEGLVGRLEGRDVGLEESLVAFERGHALQQHLTEVLKAAELRIEKITADTAIPLTTKDDEVPF